MSELLMNTRIYYGTSMLIIVISILAFVCGFERRKPKTREVVLLAVMVSLAVGGRVAFALVPNFKPVAAVVIITGIALGREAGFMCGALAMFISNIFFGQGPWTPWQMFAMGMTGFFAAIFCGKLMDKPESKMRRVHLCVMGAVLVVVIYGLVMDSANVLMVVDKPGVDAFLASYGAGAVFNLIHGASTATFLYILGPAILKKIKRIKQKHGIYKSV